MGVKERREVLGAPSGPGFPAVSLELWKEVGALGLLYGPGIQARDRPGRSRGRKRRLTRQAR